MRRPPYRLTPLGLAAIMATGCATTVPRPPDCYPGVFLDANYKFTGTYGGPDLPVTTPDCYQFRYAADGRLESVDYWRSGKLSPDPVNGVARIRVEHRDGYEYRIHEDASGKPVADRKGVYAIRLRYDAQDKPAEWGALGADGRPMAERGSRVAAVRWRRDPVGNVIEQTHLGPDGRLVEDGLRGVAVVRWRYDGRGNTVEESYFAPDSQPTPDRQRGVAVVAWRYDEGGHAVEERYLGPDSRPVEDRQRGVAMIRWVYDAAGNAVEERYFGVDARAKEDRYWRAAVLRWDHNERGERTRTTMFDLNGTLIRETSP